jgi:two-component system response regulator FixJ
MGYYPPPRFSAETAEALMVTRRVYIVDDDAQVRRYLKKVCEQAALRAETFSCGQEFLRSLEEIEPGVVLLDINMPDMTGLEVLEAMGDETRVFPVLIFTSHADISLAVRAVRSGALDFLEKTTPAIRIVERIEQAMDMQSAWDRRRTAAMKASAEIAKLTPREREVAQFMSHGLSTKEIARELGLSPRTVEANRGRILRRLDVSSAAEATRIILIAELDSIIR